MIKSLREKIARGFQSGRVPGYALFLVSMMLLGLASGMFRGVQDNYLAYLGIGKAGRGVVEFFRELPGLLLFLLLAPFYRMAERRIIRVAFLISGLGIVGFLLVGGQVVPAVACLVLWSTGEHLIMPVRRSYAIHAAEPGKEGVAMGFMRGMENAGQVVGLGLVPLIFSLSVVKNQQEAGGRLGYVVVFIIVGSVLTLAILTSLGMSGSQGKLERKKFFVQRKFVRYYGLEIFYGARKQVFLTFAPYLLILRYGADPAYLASLLGACALINIVFTPLIGRVIDKLGYRTVMIGDTCILFFVCLAYGFAHRFFTPETAFVVVSVVFILDWMISNASMASSVYVGRISENKEEMAATLSTGISINHVISVLIALGGGYIWQSLGVELLFVVAALMAVGNTLFALTIPKLEPSPS